MAERSRSRSPRDVASAAKAGNSEQEIVAVAIKRLGRHVEHLDGL